MAPSATSTGNMDDGLRLLRTFYFDTALSGSEYAAEPARLRRPPHITYGSDYPYAPAERATWFTEQLDRYEDIDHRAVNGGNAETLFPRLSALPDEPRARPDGDNDTSSTRVAHPRHR